MKAVEGGFAVSSRHFRVLGRVGVPVLPLPNLLLHMDAEIGTRTCSPRFSSAPEYSQSCQREGQYMCWGGRGCFSCVGGGHEVGLVPRVERISFLPTVLYVHETTFPLTRHSCSLRVLKQRIDACKTTPLARSGTRTARACGFPVAPPLAMLPVGIFMLLETNPFLLFPLSPFPMFP